MRDVEKNKMKCERCYKKVEIEYWIDEELICESCHNDYLNYIELIGSVE